MPPVRSLGNPQITGNSVDELRKSTQFWAQQIYNHLDRITGLRGVPTLFASLDAQGNALQNVAPASNPADAVVKAQTLTTAMGPNGEPQFDAGMVGIFNLPPGDHPEDAVNLQQVQALIEALRAQIAQAVPSGLIAMWKGTVAAIPAGWTLCNGANGTPDLRDKFVVGARQDDAGVAKTNLTGALTQTGGSINYTPAGTLSSVSAGTPAGTVAAIAATATATQITTPGVGQNTADQVHTHPAPTFTGAALAGHTHTFTGTAAQIEPPYYALCYIMKL